VTSALSAGTFGEAVTITTGGLAVFGRCYARLVLRSRLVDWSLPVVLQLPIQVVVLAGDVTLL
jgi:hypothetical protein